MNNEEKIVSELYRQYASMEAKSVNLLPASGSYRKYYRIETGTKPVIGVFNADERENEAFFSFTNHFIKNGLPVPAILASSKNDPAYLLSDLGDETLFGRLSQVRKDATGFPDEILPVYKKVIDWLPRFQVEAGKNLDYRKCYPRPAFDRQSMMWDLSYFKYYFLKLARISFDEQKLEDDFNVLIEFLLEADSNYFMYRDFQSRNIMLMESSPWFIDYQGGRRGPLQYDIASLLFDAKAAIPDEVKDSLIQYYLEGLQNFVKVDTGHFIEHYYGFVLIRILQAMGAYGFRGFYENKPHFLQSIPHAVKNLEHLLKNKLIPQNLPMLNAVLEQIIAEPEFRSFSVPGDSLKVSIYSFSYKKGLPKDKYGNGGGFMFDCRALPNPGRFEEYKKSTGLDQVVIDFLHKEPPVDEFLKHAFAIVDQSVQRYMERNFSNLMVSFGCTGGQHRSVFCAEAMAAHLRSKFNVNVEITHTVAGNQKT